MFKIIKICFYLLVLVHLCLSSTNKCSFRGKCGQFESTITGDIYPIPCVYSGDPKPFDNKTLFDELKQFVPELFKDKTPVFCCEESQVSEVLNQISIARSLTQRCPSCFVNFAKIFFHMSCAPNQAEFIDVIKSAPATLKSGQQMAIELNYYVSNKFAAGVYNSCKDVHFPSANAKVITVMCGQWGTNCNPQRLLEYLGTKDPSPIQIDFHVNDAVSKIGTKTFTPMNAKTVSCAEAAIGYSNSSCSCGDCPDKCSFEKFE